MKIGKRIISPDFPPLIIAEIGINHGGDLNVAKSMAKAAALSGCECVKHQTHFIEDEMTPAARSIYPPNADISIWEVMENCALNPDEELEFKKYCEDLGLIWISTPFSRRAVDFLDSIDVPGFKIGSGECDNLPLIRHIVSKGRPVIMSTGMQNISSLERSVATIMESGIEFALLECTNLYPSPPEIVSLGGIAELQQAFPKAQVGFSDHSIGPTMALGAAALGATIIERHFTDTRYRQGPDISNSMDPAELRFLIDRTKEIHTALRNPKRRTQPEEDVYLFARASVVADADLVAGTVISEGDIWARRPGNGDIPGYDFDRVVGRTLKVAVKRNEFLSWDMFE